jgi:hypothetical protein
MSRISGFAPGELHRLRLALGAHERVEHLLHLLQAERVTVLLRPGARFGEADRAVEVADGVHLDDPEAGVLGVLRTDPAVVRAAARDRGLALERLGAWPREALNVEIALDVAVDDRVEGPVLRAGPP